MQLWKDAGHLIRLALLLVLAIVAFLGLRQLVIPANFGQYGHFRPASLEEVRSLPIRHAGRAACEQCHTDVVETKQAGKHVIVACEACHGPLAKHAEDPTIKPVLPNTAVLCARCHEFNSARPKGFPQVKTQEHAGGEPCKTCHQPHKPKFGA